MYCLVVKHLFDTYPIDAIISRTDEKSVRYFMPGKMSALTFVYRLLAQPTKLPTNSG